MTVTVYYWQFDSRFTNVKSDMIDSLFCVFVLKLKTAFILTLPLECTVVYIRSNVIISAKR